jgi:small neutral amino acid transporter SnatA (MarC family)
MSLALLAVAAVTTVNPFRLWPALERRTAPLGALLVLGALVPLAAFADPLLDLLDISDPTARMAAGMVVVVTGAFALLTPPPSPDPALAGWGRAVVPIAFPLLFTPGLAMLAVSASVDRSAPTALVALALALVTVPGTALVRPTGVQDRVMTGAAQLAAGGAIVAGFGLVMDGVFDI